MVYFSGVQDYIITRCSSPIIKVQKWGRKMILVNCALRQDEMAKKPKKKKKVSSWLK